MESLRTKALAELNRLIEYMLATPMTKATEERHKEVCKAIRALLAIETKRT
ncbi:MAG: hypothetical protein SNG97_06360 [Rikenellaceae bacterium]